MPSFGNSPDDVISPDLGLLIAPEGLLRREPGRREWVGGFIPTDSASAWRNFHRSDSLQFPASRLW